MPTYLRIIIYYKYYIVIYKCDLFVEKNSLTNRKNNFKINS